MYERHLRAVPVVRTEYLNHPASMAWKNRPGNQFTSLPPDQSDLGNINDGPPHLNKTRLQLNDEFFSAGYCDIADSSHDLFLCYGQTPQDNIK